MKALHLVRHAAAARGGGVADRDRALSERGREEAAFLGERLRESGIRPGLIAASDARRARETAEIAARTAGLDSAVDYVAELYLADETRLLAHIRSFSDAIDVAMVIAHNPGIAALVRKLDGGGPSLTLARLGRGYPTAGLASLTSVADGWQEAWPGTFTLCDFIAPPAG